MSDIYQCIKFVDKLLEEVSMETDIRKGLNEKRDKINQRLHDPKLNLAVIGEVSAGKSTFINTLTNMNLLKEAFIATTTLPTMLTSGTGNELKVYACNGKTNYNLMLENDILSIEKKHKKQLPGRLEDKISYITSTEKIAEVLDSIKIELPQGYMEEEICIIDTPGVNPGGNDHTQHAERTISILRDKADAVVILFSALQAYTNTFEKFLIENTKNVFMNKAVFILTYMDELDQEQQEEVYDYVKRNLETRLEISNVMLIPCSAKRARDNEFWKNEFLKMKETLRDYLFKRREKIIEEQLVLLLEQLLGSLQCEIEKNNAALTKQMKGIKLYTVDNLENDLYGCMAKSKQTFEKSKETYQAKLLRAYEECHMEKKNKIKTSIFACTDVYGDRYGSIPYCCKTIIPRIDQETNKTLIEKINGVMDEVAMSFEDTYRDVNTTILTYQAGLDPVEIGQCVKVQDRREVFPLAIDKSNAVTRGSMGDIQDIAEIVIGIAGVAVVLPLAFLDGLFDTNMADNVISVFHKAGNWLAKNVAGLDNSKANTYSMISRKLDESHQENKVKFEQEVTKKLEDRYDELYGAAFAEFTNLKEQYIKFYNKKVIECNHERTRISNAMNVNRMRNDKIQMHIKKLHKE